MMLYTRGCMFDGPEHSRVPYHLLVNTFFFEKDSQQVLSIKMLIKIYNIAYRLIHTLVFIERMRISIKIDVLYQKSLETV